MAVKRSTIVYIALVVLGMLVPPLNAAIMTLDWIHTATEKFVYCNLLFWSLVAGFTLCFVGAVSWSMTRCRDLWEAIALSLLCAVLAIGFYALDIFVSLLVTAIIDLELHGLEGAF